MSIKTFSRTLLNEIPLVFLASILSVPFLLQTRFHPNTSFILDNIAIYLSLIMVISLCIQGKSLARLPKTSYYFLILAALWYVQTLIMPLNFPGQNYFAAGIFLSMSLLAFGTQALVNFFGKQKIVITIAIILVIATVLQATVGLLQLLGYTRDVNGALTQYLLAPSLYNFLLTPSRETLIYGQLAQPNHFAHYLMWGIASTIYLFGIKKLRLIYSILILTYLSFFLSASSSRTVILYIAAFIGWSTIWYLREKNSPETKRILLITIFATILIFLFQNSTTLDFFEIKNINTGISRVSNDPQASQGIFFGSRRSYEMYKAWLIFTEHPFTGTGWSQYASAAFQKDTLAFFDEEPKEIGLFTHCHNLIFQLLSEMGLICTLIVLGGFAWLIFPYFKEKASARSLLPVLLISVTFLHSMLEYPLWYVYFLAPFVIFLSLQEPLEETENFNAEILNFSQRRKSYVVHTIIIGTLSVLILLKSIMIMSDYQKIRQVYRLRNVEKSIPTVRKLTLPIIEKNSFLSYEAAYTLELSYVSDSKKYTSHPLNPEIVEINAKVTAHRPYSYPMLRRAMHLSFLGNQSESEKTMATTNHYYPVNVSEFLTTLNQKISLFPELQKQTLKKCKQLKLKNKKINCPEETQKEEDSEVRDVLKNLINKN